MNAADQAFAEEPSEPRRTEAPPPGGLQRIVRALRRITAPIQPWDFDELPARHWWDVYAR